MSEDLTPEQRARLDRLDPGLFRGSSWLAEQAALKAKAQKIKAEAPHVDEIAKPQQREDKKPVSLPHVKREHVEDLTTDTPPEEPASMDVSVAESAKAARQGADAPRESIGSTTQQKKRSAEGEAAPAKRVKVEADAGPSAAASTAHAAESTGSDA
eukprot:30738-Eustigmatos_ZCMA.PRE.1